MTLQQYAQHWDIPLTDAMLESFERYYALLVEWNQKFNLTAITDRDEVYTKHFADSLAGYSVMQGKVCDVGAGAGLPSIPLAIVGAAQDYTLLDAVNKKVTFLNTAAEALGLAKVHAVHIRAEDAGRGAMRQQYDTVCARAVAATPTLLEYLAPLAKVGGRVVLYKTDLVSEQAVWDNAMRQLGLQYHSSLDYTIEGARRCIVVLTKVRPTPHQYPRLGNKPRTNPL